MLCPRLIHNELSPPKRGLFSIVFIAYVLMTSSIPDGLSFAQLQEMMKEAPTEETNKTDKVFTQEEIAALVVPAVMAVREEIGDVSAYKHMAMYSLVKLFEFHNEVTLEIANDPDTDKEAALCWGRDAGWIQVCLNTLRNIECGPNDFFNRDE